MPGTDTADQVGPRFDICIDGHGYVTARAVDPNLPFRVQQASLAYTPTFLERTNVGQGYGDDQQAFFLTASQNDWSLGEQQKFLTDPSNPQQRSRYWRGANIDIHVPGQVTLRTTPLTASFSQVVTSVTAPPGLGGLSAGGVIVGGITKLFAVSAAGAVSDYGAHGLSVNFTSPNALASDADNVYISSTGASGVRAFQINPRTYSTFSAQPASALAVLNNTLYGTKGGILYQYDTAGVATNVFQIKSASGSTTNPPEWNLLPFGGQLLLIPPATFGGGTIYIYDGVSGKAFAQLPPNFTAVSATVQEGIVFIGGMYSDPLLGMRGAIRYIANGTPGNLWVSDDFATGGAINVAAVTAFNDGLLFPNGDSLQLCFYDLGAGTVQSVATFVAAAISPYIAATSTYAVMIGTANTTTALVWPASVYATSGTVTSSLIDFGNSLTKLLRGVKVDFDAATDGNGGSVDIAYRLNSVSGAYTTLQTGAVSGTEYLFGNNVTARSVSIRITINKGTSASGPTLKRYYVRAAPILPPYRNNGFILDLGGAGANPVRLRDGSEHNLTGEQMRANLAAAINSQTPVTITDVTGTYTGILEPGQCEFDTNRPAQYYARVQLREV